MNDILFYRLYIDEIPEHIDKAYRNHKQEDDADLYQVIDLMLILFDQKDH